MADYPDYTSPCVRICRLDMSTDVCMGCFRTLHEISYWTRYTNAERDAIRAELPERKRAAEAGKEDG